jgi:tetratricopeptide (TPR) repeat protein
LNFQPTNVSNISLKTQTFKLLSSGVALLAVTLSLGASTCAYADATDRSDVLRLINARQFDAARDLLATLSPRPADKAFVDGRILKVQGRLDEAIATFRHALTLSPGHLGVRRELAHTLLLDSQYDVAEFHFEALLQADPDPSMHDGYRRFLTNIRQNKPFGISGHFALMPSTNINRGTTQTVFDSTSGTYVIDPESQAASGIGLQLGLSGYARITPSKTSRWTLAGSLVATGYEVDVHNAATGAVSLTYDRSYEGGRWSLMPHASMTWREDDADQQITGLQFASSHRLATRTWFSVVANHDYRRYPDQTYKNGPYNKLSLGLAYQIDPSLVLRATLNTEQSRPDALHLQYDGAWLAVFVSKTWEGGLATTVSLESGTRDFVGIYPLTTSPRDDRFTTVSVTVQNPRINLRGFTPRLTCSYTANASNVVFYDYNAAECQAALTTEF